MVRLLPAASYVRIRPFLEVVPLARKHVVWKVDDPIDSMYFPRRCVPSLLVALKKRAAVEAATVGNEGMIGMDAVLGALLMTHDRAHADTFPLTHQVLALMLGVRRASVTVAAGRLQRARLIHYSYGLVTVENRRGLELAACECYQTVEQRFQRLFDGHADAATMLQ